MITKAKYQTTCFSCAQTIYKGEDIDFDNQDKSIRHLVCPKYCDECGVKIISDNGLGNYHKLNCERWRPRWS